MLKMIDRKRATRNLRPRQNKTQDKEQALYSNYPTWTIIHQSTKR